MAAAGSDRIAVGKWCGHVTSLFKTELHSDGGTSSNCHGNFEGLLYCVIQNQFRELQWQADLFPSMYVCTVY